MTETHVHTQNCIEEDVIDLGDDGEGYIAEEFYVCNITGEQHIKLDDFGIEESL